MIAVMSELHRGELLGVATGLLLTAASFWLRRYLTSPLPEPRATESSVQLWRDLHFWWASAFINAGRALTGVCSARSGEEQVKLCLFARKFAAAPLEASLYRLDKLLWRANMSESDVEAVGAQMETALMEDYRNLYAWLDATGTSVLGREGLRSDPLYGAWCRSHAEAVGKMSRNKADLGRAASWIPTLESFPTEDMRVNREGL